MKILIILTALALLEVLVLKVLLLKKLIPVDNEDTLPLPNVSPKYRHPRLRSK